MLAARYTQELDAWLLPGESFRPFPTVEDRDAWNGLPEELRRAQAELGERVLGYSWPALPATLFMDFKRTGNRERYEHPYQARRSALCDLVFAECIEDRGRFLDDITNGVWAICEETTWVIPAHNHVAGPTNEPLPDISNPGIDLMASETGALLAWTHYLLKPRLDRVSRLVCDRIEWEVKRRIIDPYLEREDYWWMGFGTARRMNNWNPWCNSNCLAALLLLERGAGRRVAGVAKALRSLDRFIESYSPDGGCDEGSSYWNRAGGSLFDCLELLHAASNGRIDAYAEPLVAEIGRFMVRAYIGGDYFINFADGGAKVHPDAALLYAYGRRIGDPALQGLGAAAHRARRSPRSVGGSSPQRRLRALFEYENLEKAQAKAPFLRDVWLPDTQVMAAREREGTDRGLYVAAKGGHNNESHNHNDIGNFIVYLDAEPVIIDVGVGTYTAQTFSSRRYEIWTMQSGYHNLPTIGGVEQRAGAGFRAAEVDYRSGDALAELSMNLSQAYPPEAGIRFWRRTVRLHRSGEASIEVVDDFELDRAQEIVLNLMTPAKPRIEAGETAAEGVIRLGREARVRLAYDASALAAEDERIPIDDGKLARVWGDEIFRIRLRSRVPVRAAVWRMRITAASRSL